MAEPQLQPDDTSASFDVQEFGNELDRFQSALAHLGDSLERMMELAPGKIETLCALTLQAECLTGTAQVLGFYPDESAANDNTEATEG